MNTKKHFILFPILTAVIISCTNIKQENTTLEIVDNNRHYYPILQGEELDIVFVIKNTGDVPFILSELITSCGCILSDKSSIEAISPGKEGRLTLKYDSNKNVGYVKHYITLYGNLETDETDEIVFDLHVVPNALYTKDYEELYLEEKNKNPNVNKNIDRSSKGYYIDGESDK